MNIKQELTPAVILDITYSGYGVLRSLYPYNIPLYGFTFDAKHVEVKTKFATKVIVYKNNGKDLKEKLIALSKTLNTKPVLILTNDEKVQFVVDHLTELRSYYIINMPDKPLTDQLIDKIQLKPLIEDLNILAPKTLNIESANDYQRVKELQFPVIVKPFLKSEKWYEAGFHKAIIFNSVEELDAMFLRLIQAESKLLIQEFIPGGDDHIYFCLTYYDFNHNCKAIFTGQKIRQWNPLTGSTASAKCAIEPIIEKETKRIFDHVKFQGIGSVEFKKHARTGEFYLVEPTVGRVNLQEYLATAAGTNIPLVAYCDMTGLPIKAKEKQTNNAIYFDELNEILSVSEYQNRNELTLSEWLQSVKGKKSYRYLFTTDWPIVMKMSLFVARRVFGIIYRSIKRH